MIFHSYDYLFFFALFFGLYWSVNFNLQNILIPIASFIFYGYVHPWFLSIMLVSTFTDYLSAMAMERYASRKKIFLFLSLAVNLGILIYFKYFNFFVENFNALFAQLGLATFKNSAEFILPVGISFYTFQSMSYTIDVYRGELKARRNPIHFAAFVTFFPQLVAGPIERARDLLVQIERPRKLQFSLLRDGAYLIAWGLFKKLAIADNVAVYVEKIFHHQVDNFYVLWAGVFAFTIQILADFSAYTDIARGSAKLLGFELKRNFNHPYWARTPLDFWRRWHMSLSTWFKDYVYIPLGGSKKGNLSLSFNLMLTFFLSGLWHGASWNFVFWGLFHGALVVLCHFKLFPSSRLLTFATVMFGWLLFREHELRYLKQELLLSPFAWGETSQYGLFICVLVFFYSLPLLAHSFFAQYFPKTSKWRGRVYYASFLLLPLLTALFKNRSSANFIYFQF